MIQMCGIAFDGDHEFTPSCIPHPRLLIHIFLAILLFQIDFLRALTTTLL